MITYLLQLNKRQAKTLCPSALNGAFLNVAREEPIPTAIPNISLLPRGGYWFSIISPSRDSSLKFMAYCTNSKLCINHRIKIEENLSRIDLEAFANTNIQQKYETTIIKSQTISERQEKEIMDNMQMMQESIREQQQEEIEMLPTPSNMFGK